MLINWSFWEAGFSEIGLPQRFTSRKAGFSVNGFIEKLGYLAMDLFFRKLIVRKLIGKRSFWVLGFSGNSTFEEFISMETRSFLWKRNSWTA